MIDYSALSTESRNLKTSDIDKMSAAEIAMCINNEDKTVAFAVEKALDKIALGIDALADVLKNGGRIFYCGAGTSGRLGVVDASECRPTYGVPKDTVIGMMAGGYDAVHDPAVEAEDDPEDVKSRMKLYGFSGKDALVAISASGGAACVVGALAYATELGARKLCVTCNKNSALVPLVDIAIVAEVGPEVILGSTRMKAGTAQKMILNMLSTGAMVRYGRVRGNYMAYMVPSNKKLVDRAVRMICEKTGATPEKAAKELEKANNIIADAMDVIEKENSK